MEAETFRGGKVNNIYHSQLEKELEGSEVLVCLLREVAVNVPYELSLSQRDAS